jgi:hypothetical protein
MRTLRLLSHIRHAALPCLALLLLQACGGSSTSVSSVTSPSSVTRCAITMQPVEGPLPSSGGNGAIALTAARECAWTASVEGAWLSLRSGTSGQGDGTVEFAATANPDPVTRRGAVVANGQRSEISQAAGECELSLAQSFASFNQSGGSGQVQVRASSGMCSWSAAADAEWVQIRGGSGQGNGVVTFDIPSSTGPPRSATINVAGQKFSIVQSEGCTYTINPGSFAATPAGGSTRVAINTTASCPWTAVSNVSWLSLSPASGSGPASVTVNVAGTSGRSRTGTAVLAGQPFAVTQSQGCAYSVQPGSASVGAGGGTVTVTITSNAECDWSASSNDSWIALQGRGSGAGSGTVTFAVAATTGPSRSGSAVVAGQTVTISQTQGCSYAISPENASAPAGASTGKVTVTAGTGCSWSASSNASWLTITSGSSGSGNGEVQYSAAAATGPSRSGTLTIAGKTFTLNQGDGCSFSLSSTTANIDDGGGQGTFTVQSASGCAWTATSAVPWVTISSGSSGTGTGTVRFTAAANSGPPRNGTITAGGQTFTVQQGNGCSYSLSSGSTSFPASGGSGTVNVSAGAGCGWTATSNGAWLTVTSGASGTGNGTVGFTAASTTGPQRTGVITIGGETFRVMQAEGCTFTISPEQVSVGATAGTTPVGVTTNNSCAWTTQINAPWLSIAAGATGSGNATVQVGFEVNGGGPRSGTVTIAGKTFTVNQGSGCSFTINPTAQTVAASGGPVMVSVGASAGCAWTAASNAPWLTITAGASGNGAGNVQVDAQPNPGAPRSGTATIAGQTLTVSQESGCTFVVNPEVIASPAGGSSAHIEISAAPSCAWNATSSVPWISIVSATAGNGNGAIDVAAAGNTGPARSGTLLVAGRTVTINQDSGCVITLGAPSATMGAGGGAGSVAVSASGGCNWTAVSNAPWIQVTGGSPGSGGGTVTFNVDANPTGAPRSGAIDIGGVAFTVSQQ